MPDSTPKRRFSRRDFLKLASMVGLDFVILGIGGAGYAVKVEPTWVETTNIRLKLPRLPPTFSGFRIVQLSDIHLGPWMSLERFGSILTLAMDQTPDMVALTGDFILDFRRGSNYTNKLAEMAAALAKMTQKYLTVAVLGNHDHWYDAFKIQAALEGGGVHVLRNSVYTLERGGERFHVAGIDDAYDRHDDFDAVLAQLPTDGCAMALVHEPDYADISAPTGRFDLQISGHSHGGQVVLPFIGAPILPRLGEKYPSGLYQVGNMFQYTNRGIGMTPPPVRFNCRPELTVLTLESA
jgi:uncharacterized protein